MINYTTEHRAKLEAYLETHELPSGLGDKESACTLAAINLAMTGKLTDDIPACMSKVLGRAAIRLQDAMPDDLRNSARYKALIPNMPGTGREREAKRLAVLMDWIWAVVFPQVQPVADKHGFGAEWSGMCTEKTVNAADAAADAARAAATYAAYAAATYAAYAAATYAAATYADAAAARAADAAADAARAADANFWSNVDPIGVLERMTYLGEAESHE